MKCEVRIRRIGQSGHAVLATDVTPNEASRVIASQPSTPGYVIWRVDYV